MTKNKEVTLLLVEDDDVDAITVERGLQKRRIANPIMRARDGQEAIEWLRADKVPKPYIILLDIQTPRLDGIEFLNELRADSKLHDSVVFVLTTSKAQSDIDATYSKNVAGYFVKDEAGHEFSQVAEMLQGYWKIVYLPHI